MTPTETLEFSKSSFEQKTAKVAEMKAAYDTASKAYHAKYAAGESPSIDECKALTRQREDYEAVARILATTPERKAEIQKLASAHSAYSRRF